LPLIYRYKTPAVSEAKKQDLLASAKKIVSASIKNIESEFCFYIDASTPLTADESELLRWLLSETFEPGPVCRGKFLKQPPFPNPQ